MNYIYACTHNCAHPTIDTVAYIYRCMQAYITHIKQTNKKQQNNKNCYDLGSRGGFVDEEQAPVALPTPLFTNVKFCIYIQKDLRLAKLKSHYYMYTRQCTDTSKTV